MTLYDGIARYIEERYVPEPDFSAMYAAHRPTKKTVLALAIALELDLPETTDLLRRAGFALSHSNKADIIVEYFIVHGLHDIMAVNEALYAFDQPLL